MSVELPVDERINVEKNHVLAENYFQFLLIEILRLNQVVFGNDVTVFEQNIVM
jgi:hypothetical protein